VRDSLWSLHGPPWNAVPSLSHSRQ